MEPKGRAYNDQYKDRLYLRSNLGESIDHCFPPSMAFTRRFSSSVATPAGLLIDEIHLSIPGHI
jgi:hypothetical protein